ncbi:hypothetical protein DBR47_07825 [Paucibacter sp. KBW04]|uniref:RidA family protein n=1 Tax=Paucibacter sp. KBW04 TaxID=2153361 RepID=UPI000F57D94D|nr:RidA family protein [Paucibacter sp. KBW04]RQO61137.1 hypothetical protein DBR47_07825 [Paucibacter sp. KBW04]
MNTQPPTQPPKQPSLLVQLGVPPTASDQQPRPLSPAVRAGDFIYVSGQVPVDAEGQIVPGGIEAQTRQVMAQIQSILALAGATLDDVCKTTVWLEDARDFGAFNRVYMGYFPQGKPARSTVEARLMIPAKVEIDVVAYRPLAARL